MQSFPDITTLLPNQRAWLNKKMADFGISYISKEKEEAIALGLNGPVATKKQIRAIGKK